MAGMTSDFRMLVTCVTRFRSVALASLACALTVMAGATSAQAATQTFSTGDSQFLEGVDNQGWWSWNNYPNQDVNDSVFVGAFFFGPIEYRNFFSFDLSNVSGTVTAATVKVRRSSVEAPDGVFEYGLFDVSTDVATLNYNNDSSSTIYDDLGTGAALGGLAIDAINGSPDDVLSIPLNAAGVAAVNSAIGGFFSIGGASVDQNGASFPQGSNPLETALGGEGYPTFLEVEGNLAPTCGGLAPTITGDGIVTGTKNADVIITGDGNDTVNGGGGDDTICTGAGDDTANGGAGDDRVYGQAGSDATGGGPGDDVVDGGGGNDPVNGGAGNDTVNGGAGNDSLNGGNDDDTVVGGTGSDKLAGNAGTDTCAGDNNGGPAQAGTDKVTATGQCETTLEVP